MLIRLPEVLNRLKVSRSTIYAWMRDGRFPKPIKLGLRPIAWLEDAVDAFIAARREAIS